MGQISLFYASGYFLQRRRQHMFEAKNLQMQFTG